jgi:hypothetical protein
MKEFEKRPKAVDIEELKKYLDSKMSASYET